MKDELEEKEKRTVPAGLLEDTGERAPKRKRAGTNNIIAFHNGLDTYFFTTFLTDNTLLQPIPNLFFSRLNNTIFI